MKQLKEEAKAIPPHEKNEKLKYAKMSYVTYLGSFSNAKKDGDYSSDEEEEQDNSSEEE